MEKLPIRTCGKTDVLCHIDNIRRKLNNIIVDITDFLGGKIQDIWAFLQKLPGKITKSVTTIVENVKDFLSKQITNVINIVNHIKEKVAAIVDNIADKLNGVMAKITEKVKGVYDKIVAFIDIVKQKFSDITQTITEKISDIWKNIKNQFSVFQEWLSMVLQDFRDNVREWISYIKEQITELISQLWDFLKTKFVEIKESVENAIHGVIETIGKAVTRIKERITEIVGEIQNMFSELIEDLIAFLRDLWLEVKEWVENQTSVSQADVEEFVKMAVSLYNSQFDKIEV
jgi:phage-related protein